MIAEADSSLPRLDDSEPTAYRWSTACLISYYWGAIED